MENTPETQTEQTGKFEIFNTPEELAASMAQETVQSEPQSEPQEEYQSEPEQQQFQESSYVDPDAAPSYDDDDSGSYSDVVDIEPTQYQVADSDQYDNDDQGIYSDEEIESAVYTYLSERLGREINSFDELQPTYDVDERVQAIAEFVAETGRNPEDWFTYQSMNPAQMDDLTVVRVQMAQQYPNLSFEEVNMLVGNKYKLDPEIYDEKDIQMSTLQLKIDAEDARHDIETIRETYAAPDPQQRDMYEEGGIYLDDSWMQNMAAETDAMEALEFDLGGEKTFTYSLDDSHRDRLIHRNSEIDSFFDSYIFEDGSWDYDRLNAHFAVIDNIDSIVSSAYRQGLGDGQKAVVTNAANISNNVSPSSSQNLNQDDPLTNQLRNLMKSGSNKLTFNI